MADQLLQPAPFQAPLTSAGGKVSPEFIRWFNAITQAGNTITDNGAAIKTLQTQVGNLQTSAAIDEAAIAANVTAIAATNATVAALSTVARTGSYTDLLNQPVIPAAQVASDWNAISGVAAILNKPTLGSAAAKNVSDFDPAGAWSSWTGNVAANAHTLSGVSILATAGLQVSAFCAIAGTLNYSDGAATYMTSSNAGSGAWNEFSYYLQKGAALANDEFWISVNSRTTAGGADAYSPALRIKALTGAVTLPTQTTFSVAPVFGDAAGTRSALGLGAVATLATVPIANGGTGQTTAAAALAALGGAALAGGNSFSGLQTNASGAHLTGFTNPSGATTGGLELGWDGVESVVQSYKRSTSTYQPLWVGGSSVQLLAGGVEKARLSSGGNILVGSTSDNAVDRVQVSGSLSVSGVVKVGSAAPATSAAAGVAGAITWDSGFLYVCVALNSWRRIALTAF